MCFYGYLFLASCLDKEQNGLIAHRTCFVNLEPRCVAALSLFIAMMMCNFGRFDICQKANCSSSSRSSHFSPFDAHFAAQTQQTIFFRISCNGRRVFPDEQRKKKACGYPLWPKREPCTCTSRCSITLLSLVFSQRKVTIYR